MMRKFLYSFSTFLAFHILKFLKYATLIPALDIPFQAMLKVLLFLLLTPPGHCSGRGRGSGSASIDISCRGRGRGSIDISSSGSVRGSVSSRF